jgi:hypothetical protein
MDEKFTHNCLKIRAECLCGCCAAVSRQTLTDSAGLVPEPTNRKRLLKSWGVCSKQQVIGDWDLDSRNRAPKSLDQSTNRDDRKRQPSVFQRAIKHYGTSCYIP